MKRLSSTAYITIFRTGEELWNPFDDGAYRNQEEAEAAAVHWLDTGERLPSTVDLHPNAGIAQGT